MYSPEKMTVGQLLSLTNPPIVVPDWQRNYSWTDSHVETFWSDLLSFHARYPTEVTIRAQEYFLGSVVIVIGGENHLLLDGQQRIATAAILLSVIREFLRRFSAEARQYATQIDTRIVLIDGKELARLMIEHGVGVSTATTYEVKKIDFDYFVEDGA